LDESLEARTSRLPLPSDGVSILVLLDESLEAAQYKKTIWLLPVSILVLLDESLEAVDGNCINPSDRFQSLFSWMNRSKSHSIADDPRYDQVSILVLLDESLEVG